MCFLPVKVLDLVLVINDRLDGDIARPRLAGHDLLQKAVGEAHISHPSQILGSQVDVGNDAQTGREEAQRALIALCDGDEIHLGPDTFENRQRRVTRLRDAVEVGIHGIAAATGNMANGDAVECACSIAPLSQPIEDLVRNPVTRTAENGIVGIDINPFGNDCTIPNTLGVHDGIVTLSLLQDRLHLDLEDLAGEASPAVRIHNDLKASSRLTMGICSCQESSDKVVRGTMSCPLDSVAETRCAHSRFW